MAGQERFKKLHQELKVALKARNYEWAERILTEERQRFTQECENLEFDKNSPTYVADWLAASPRRQVIYHMHNKLVIVLNHIRQRCDRAVIQKSLKQMEEAYAYEADTTRTGPGRGS